MGRPRIAHHQETLRLSTQDADYLGALASEWRCSRSEVVRRLLAALRAGLREAVEGKMNEGSE